MPLKLAKLSFDDNLSVLSLTKTRFSLTQLNLNCRDSVLRLCSRPYVIGMEASLRGIRKPKTSHTVICNSLNTYRHLSRLRKDLPT
jgi:hypothetical protein